jgi:hypothetical protein
VTCVLYRYCVCILMTADPASEPDGQPQFGKPHLSCAEHLAGCLVCGEVHIPDDLVY